MAKPERIGVFSCRTVAGGTECVVSVHFADGETWWLFRPLAGGVWAVDRTVVGGDGKPRSRFPVMTDRDGMIGRVLDLVVSRCIEAGFTEYAKAVAEAAILRIDLVAVVRSVISEVTVSPPGSQATERFPAVMAA